MIERLLNSTRRRPAPRWVLLLRLARLVAARVILFVDRLTPRYRLEMAQEPILLTRALGRPLTADEARELGR